MSAPVADLIQQADARRAQAKRLLGLLITDQVIASQIVDDTITAATLEVTGMMRSAVGGMND